MNTGIRTRNDEAACLTEARGIAELIRTNGLPRDNIAPLFPAMFTWRAGPYTVKDHYQFEAFHTLRIPKLCTIKGARQIAKTTNMAARLITLCGIPHKPALRISIITPLYEQVRRISNDYVAPLLNGSVLKTAWVGPDSERSVLRRSFNNGALLRFGYAFLSAEGLRGIDNDILFIDEYQDFKAEHMGVIVPSLSASTIGAQVHAGSAKGVDTSLAASWQSSSQAEWCVRCMKCRKDNIPALAYDLERMIGPMRKTIGPDHPATICARCSSVIYPEQHGVWVHKHPALAERYPGYHISQPIMKMHYGSPEKWADILSARELRKGYTPTQVKNEIYGEEAGSGVQMLTSDDLKRAAILGFPNTPRDMLAGARRFNRNRYLATTLAVDWGGGGESGESLTVVTIMGITVTGIIEVVWGQRLYDPHAHIKEAQDILRIVNAFNPHFVAHDYTGAGAIKEAVLIAQGCTTSRLIPIRYASAAVAPLMTYRKPKSALGYARPHHVIDKARSLVLTIAAIQTQKIRFFNYDHHSRDDPGLLHDFLALTDRKITSDRGTDTYVIGRLSGHSDDFAQAVNIGACALWHRTKLWPKVDVPNKYNLSKEAEQELAPDWTEDDYVTAAEA